MEPCRIHGRKNVKMKNIKYDCEISLFSDIGDTPLTKRGGKHRDELLRTTIQVASPTDARQKCIDLINATPHAVTGFWYAPKDGVGPTDGLEYGQYPKPIRREVAA